MVRYYAVYDKHGALKVVNRAREARNMAEGIPTGYWNKVGWLEARRLKKQIESLRNHSENISKLVK